MKALIGVLLILISISLSGCADTDISSEEGKNQIEDADTISIGMCFDSFVIERWEKDRDIFVATARDLGADVNVQNANGEAEEQVRQIEYFTEKGVDAIVIICIDSESIQDAVKKAKSRGIKIIAYDRMISMADVDLYVSFDNEMVGCLMAEALNSAEIEKPKVIMLQGPNTDNNVSLVRQGFTKICGRNGMDVIASMNADQWKAENAADYLEENSELLEEADGIMCGNDNVATAVVRVLSEKRKAGKIMLVGQDADLEACQRIVEGTQNMTVYKPVEAEAKEAAKTTVALIKGEKIDNLNYLSDGRYEVPSIILEPIAVTKDNIDSVIIDSGFHLKDEVYLNVQRK